MRFAIFVLCVVSLVACQQAKSKSEIQPETKSALLIENESLETFSGQQKKSALTVHQHVKGNNVYVECIIDGFSFANDQGFLQVKIDGKSIEQVKQAAFVLKNLSKGSHDITIELMKTETESYHLMNAFTVDII
ncbi:hypothetical protein FZC66_03165 [Priestia megaterium]|nr:hypothetical protein FZC66_03165 [Priestia megaterium]